MKLTLVFVAATSTLLSGCATSKLWEADHFAKFREPAPEAHLRLLQSDHNGDVLVEYDELQPGKGNTRRRAYFLYENDAKVRASKKPEFLTRPATEGLKPIQVFLQQPEAGTEPQDLLFAVASTNGHKFTLLAPGTSTVSVYELPVYRVSSGRLTQVLLTPPAVIADATVVGGFVVVIFWPGLPSFSL